MNGGSKDAGQTAGAGGGGSIIVSLRSKGLSSYNRATFFDVRYQAVQFATAVIDIFVSALVTAAALSWTAWISIGISVINTAATFSIDKSTAPAGYLMDSLFPFYMYTILPLLILLVLTFWRRERALSHLAHLKAAFVTLLLDRACAAESGSSGDELQKQLHDASDELQRTAVVYLEDLHRYLQYKRPYAQHFYMPYRATNANAADDLFCVSREMGVQLRKVHRGVRDMHLAALRLRGAGLPEAQVSSLVARIQQLHVATEGLSSIKEMRTPVIIRAMVRWFVAVLLPVLLGPYWNGLRHVLGVGFSGVFSIFSQIALMAVYDTATSLEDPFDEAALDTISLLEVLDHLALMTAPPGTADGAVATGSYAAPVVDPATGLSLTPYDASAGATASGPELAAPATLAMAAGPSPPGAASNTQQQQQQQRESIGYGAGGGGAGGAAANGASWGGPPPPEPSASAPRPPPPSVRVSPSLIAGASVAMPPMPALAGSSNPLYRSGQLVV